MEDRERRPNPSFNPDEESLAAPGGKREWERLADSIPSNEKNDPKPHEPRTGDMSLGKSDVEDGGPK